MAKLITQMFNYFSENFFLYNNCSGGRADHKSLALDPSTASLRGSGSSTLLDVKS